MIKCEFTKIQKNIREININSFTSDIRFEECVKYTQKQKQIEKIIIADIIKEIIYEFFPTTSYTYLTHLEITLFCYDNTPQDYIFPFLRNTSNLQTLIYSNAVLTRSSIYFLLRNENLKNISLKNVDIFDHIKIKNLLFSLKQLEKLEITYNNFKYITNKIRIIQIAFETSKKENKLKHLKIIARQEMFFRNFNDYFDYHWVTKQFKLYDGTIIAFFLLILPLIMLHNTLEIDIRYENINLPNTESEKSYIKFSIADIIDNYFTRYEMSN